MLCDELMYGVGLTSELTGVPWATFGDGPLPYFEPDTPPFGPGLSPMRGPVGELRNRAVAGSSAGVFAEAQRRYDEARAELGLPPADRPVLEESISPYLHLQGAVPSFDYPRRRLPQQMHWVGALRPTRRPWPRPDWWAEVIPATKPVMLVSQGSIRPDLTELVGPALRALADRARWSSSPPGRPSPVDLERTYGDPLPANVRVAKRSCPTTSCSRHVELLRHQWRLHRRHAGPASRRTARAGRHHRGEGRDRGPYPMDRRRT